jgi:hypothetical protein
MTVVWPGRRVLVTGVVTMSHAPFLIGLTVYN